MNLKRAPKVMSSGRDFDHIYEDMYIGCDSLQEIHWNKKLGEDGWEEWYPGAPRFGAPASTKVIFDL